MATHGRGPSRPRAVSRSDQKAHPVTVDDLDRLTTTPVVSAIRGTERVRGQVWNVVEVGGCKHLVELFGNVNWGTSHDYPLISIR